MLAIFISPLGLFTLSLAISLPAQASIVCEVGTINNYPNGSLATCILSQNMNLQISSSRTGSSNFPCKAKNYIFFDEKGQFRSCQLAEEIQIRSSNSIEVCPADAYVDVSLSEYGSLLVNCQSVNQQTY